ncbi:malto-oligosyltrehalose trehalohydrolase [soil metagenome]
MWAPAAEQVDLVLADGTEPMRATSSGWWAATRDLGAGVRYRFALDRCEPLADPRALRLPEGPDGPAEVVDLAAMAWTDRDWRGVELHGTVIYELHVGTFTTDGTLDAAIHRLDHLVDLGVGLVELMPLASFPGRHGWGYDGVGLWAVHEPYGGPAALARFVDACHARGMGVCRDVFYNHLGSSGNRLPDFGPYFTDQYQTPWGAAVNLDGPGSDEVRRFITDNALMWLRDQHIDALRLDAVHALHDERALPLLEQLSAEVDALAEHLGRPLWLIAESDRNDPRTVTPRDQGGLGIHAQWADDVHHGLHAALTGETQGYYAEFAEPGALAKVLSGIFLHDGTWSAFRGRTHGRPLDRSRTPGWRFVASLQTHDQVGNRATGDRLSATLDVGSLACGAALLLTGPATPMLFMGEEWGASTPWQYFTDHPDPELADAVRQGRRREFGSHGWAPDDVPDPQDAATVVRSRLDWAEPERAAHARLLQWYRDLIALRRARADLSDPRLYLVEVRQDHVSGTVVLERGRHRVVVNLSDKNVSLNVGVGELTVVAAFDPADTHVNSGTVQLPCRSATVLGPR